MTAASVSEPSRRLPAWWLGRGLVHRIARLRYRLRGGTDGIVPGVVIVGVPTEDERVAIALASLRRITPTSSTVITDQRRGNPFELRELACPPGTERAVARTLRRATTSPELLITRLPEVVWESETVPRTAPRVVRHGNLRLACEAMGIDPDRIAGRGVLVGIVDEDMRTDVLGDTIVELRPPTNPMDPPFEPSTPDRPLHGTAVASIILDVAPGAELVALTKPTNIKLFLPGMLRTLAAHAGGGPVVVNLSLSYRVDALEPNERRAFEDAIDGTMRDYYDRMLIVAAAGNVRTRSTPMAYPARSRYVIGICAANSLGVLSRHSRHGKDLGVWYLAPGGYQNADRAAPLVSIGDLDFFGTSIACALASGFIARVLQPDDEPMSLADVRTLLSQSADANQLLTRPATSPRKRAGTGP